MSVLQQRSKLVAPSIEIDSPSPDPDGLSPITVSAASPLTVSGKAFTEGEKLVTPNVQCYLRFFDGGQTPDQQPSGPITLTQELGDTTAWDWTATFSYVPTALQETEAYAILVGTTAPAAGPDVFWIQPPPPSRK